VYKYLQCQAVHRVLAPPACLACFHATALESTLPLK
jgi:hypothetical protein